MNISREGLLRPRSDCFEDIQAEFSEPVLLHPLECDCDALWDIKDPEDPHPEDPHPEDPHPEDPHPEDPLHKSKPMDNLQSASHNQPKSLSASVGTSQASGYSHPPGSTSIRHRHRFMKVR